MLVKANMDIAFQKKAIGVFTRFRLHIGYGEGRNSTEHSIM